MEIKFIEPDGTLHTLDVEPGLNAMEAAIQNGVPGIDGDCGGNAACGTCHILIDADWIGTLNSTRSENEEAMLELIQDAQPNSRLACQVKLDPAMGGLVIHLPEAQF
jgi:ferredoxin, 2Fe-2S